MASSCLPHLLFFFFFFFFFNLVDHSLNESVVLERPLKAIFTRVPPSISKDPIAFFQFIIYDAQGGNPCPDCIVKCQLDDNIPEDCLPGNLTYTALADGHHVISILTGTFQIDTIAAQYNWTIDTVHPTAYISASSPFTNAANVSLDIIFSEPCPGMGGFKCNSSSLCDVIANGPGQVIPSSLVIIRDFMEYKIVVGLPTMHPIGRVKIMMAQNFCTDYAGNIIERSENSTYFIHFDRKIPSVNVWTSVPEYRVKIGNKERTVKATNDLSLLHINVDFSVPIFNTTVEILSALKASTGQIAIANNRTHGNRHFHYLLYGISGAAVTTISLETKAIVSRFGSSVTSQYSTTSVSFLYDSIRPFAFLSALSLAGTKEETVHVAVEFTKPVFSFGASDIRILGGLLKSFHELSKSLYILEVSTRDGGSMSVYVPANRTKDISGNLNIQSDALQVRNYFAPSISVALYSFTTAAVLSTSFTAGILCISSTSLAAAGALSSQSATNIYSDPSRNLLGLVSHLQVFALSDWLSIVLPTEYHETTKGLQWLIPHLDLPWKIQKKGSLSPQSPPNSFDSAMLQGSLWSGNLYLNIDQLVDLVRGNRSDIIELEKKKSSTNNSIFGPPLDPSEYAMYFACQGPKPLAEDVFNIKAYSGWEDFMKNMFWLGVIGGGLVALHMLFFFLIRAKVESDMEGIFAIPRFELFLLILALPCLCQASGFLLRGGSLIGILVGVLLLSVPSAFVSSALLLISVAVFMGSMVRFEEVAKHEGSSWHGALLGLIAGTDASRGEWVRKEGVGQSFLDRFGLLFEDRRGPEHQSNNNDEDNRGGNKLTGAFRCAYIIVDLARRMALGLVFGVYGGSDPSKGQVFSALLLTVVQLIYLLALKPYIRRGVQVAETLSLLCEAGVFATALVILVNSASKSAYLDILDSEHLGHVMIFLLLLCLLSQLLNEWYALMSQLTGLSPSVNPAPLMMGIKLFLFGLAILLLPQYTWSRLLPRSPPLPPPSTTHTDSKRRSRRITTIESPSSDLDNDNGSLGPEIRADSTETAISSNTNSGQGPKLAGNPKTEDLRRLQGMAKESFSSARKECNLDNSNNLWKKPSRFLARFGCRCGYGNQPSPSESSSMEDEFHANSKGSSHKTPHITPGGKGRHLPRTTKK